MFIMVLGIVYATCAIVIFFRDLTQVINIILQVGMWMTPIMWNIDTMELSPVLITIFKLNPMYYIVAGYRDALINKAWFWENAPLTLYFWLLTAVLFGIGTMIFKRLKIHFADVL
jgi:teichoic acid transport system permease protein